MAPSAMPRPAVGVHTGLAVAPSVVFVVAGRTATHNHRVRLFGSDEDPVFITLPANVGGKLNHHQEVLLLRSPLPVVGGGFLELDSLKGVRVGSRIGACVVEVPEASHETGMVVGRSSIHLSTT